MGCGPGLRDPLDTESTVESEEDWYAFLLDFPGVPIPSGHDAQWLIANFAGPAVVSAQPTITESFDWNRGAIDDPNNTLGPGPSTAARVLSACCSS
jgi:hypothetical protein